ncbi:MAG: hypothetical protein ACRC80_29185 [Waterburya sp.]
MTLQNSKLISHLTFDHISIPGTKKRDRVTENAQAVEIELSQPEKERIEAVMPLNAAAGTRYPEAIMDTVNR